MTFYEKVLLNKKCLESSIQFISRLISLKNCQKIISNKTVNILNELLGLPKKIYKFFYRNISPGLFHPTGITILRTY